MKSIDASSKEVIMNPIVKVQPSGVEMQPSLPGEGGSGQKHPLPESRQASRRPNLELFAQALQEVTGVTDIKLQYSINSPNGQIAVKVFDRSTGKLIREIPARELLALAESMKELEGVLFDANI
jgi:flagellar protein FlaG